MREILGVIGVCTIIGALAFVILSAMSSQVQEDMLAKCNALHGDLQFFECMGSADWFVEEGDRCRNKITGYVCVLSNGTEIQFTYDILHGEVSP